MENRTRPRHGIKLVEGRKHNRFRVQQGGFVSLYPYFAVVGQIMDIGSDGLAFRYVASEERTNGSTSLNILLTNRSFCMEKVPFKTTWDFPIPRDFSFGPITLRHCGVQFAELTRSQKLDLEYFIRFYTLDEVGVSHGIPPHNERKIAYLKASSCSRGSTSMRITREPVELSPFSTS